MWNTIFLNIIISIIIIAITHHIWEHLKTNYSVQKTKNLAEIHATKYKTMLDDLSVAPLTYEAQSLIESSVCPRNLTANANRSPDLFAIRCDEVQKKVLSSNVNDKFISLEEQAWMKRELDDFIQSL